MAPTLQIHINLVHMALKDIQGTFLFAEYTAANPEHFTALLQSKTQYGIGVSFIQAFYECKLHTVPRYDCLPYNKSCIRTPGIARRSYATFLDARIIFKKSKSGLHADTSRGWKRVLPNSSYFGRGKI